MATGRRTIRSFAALLLLGTLTALRAQENAPLEVQPTRLIRGPAGAPSAVLDLTLLDGCSAEALVRIQDPSGQPLSQHRPGARESGAHLLLSVPLPAEGQTQSVLVELVDAGTSTTLSVDYPRPETGWTLHFVPGFHYDPVWWNTQAHYTETGRNMDSHVGPGFQLIEQHLALTARDPDYKVALHQLPYLKTWIEAHPEALAQLKTALATGRAGLVGGSYNEFSSTLVSAEAAARNAIYGVLFQRDVAGGDGSVFWQCDVFGHDPSFPSLMADSGHDAGAFARGPFHQWGAPRELVHLPSEFNWAGPDGRQVLTHYMTGHYGYAYSQFAAGSNRAPDDPARQEQLVAGMFADLSRVALTHNVLLPMHMDFIRPLENLGDVVRGWNERYLSPRAVVDTSEGFFDAVRAEIETRDLVVPTITRDMNPIYTGCPVSFADLKQANRAAETALRDAEILATLATVLGAPYPEAGLDRAWRQLLFCAHHDGITGSMSDQVYLDILAAYRDALEIAQVIGQRAMTALAHHVDTRDIEGGLVVWNTLGQGREGWVETDGGLLPTAQVPAVGYRVVPGGARARSPSPTDPTVLENEFFRLQVDPVRGGALISLIDKDTGRELLAAPANVLRLLEEYPVLPGHGEGPWHLAPTGASRTDLDQPVQLLPRQAGHPQRLVLEGARPEYRKRVSIELLPGARRIDFQTDVLDWKGTNQLLRVEFPMNLPGARPVHQTAAAVIGRPFARDVDTASDPWTLDQACWQWSGLGSTCTLDVVEGRAGRPLDGGRLLASRALAVAEIVLGDQSPPARMAQANQLALALAASGVTSTITREDDRRYGDLEHDSNTPDVRILLGQPGEHGLLERTLAQHTLQPVPSAAWVEDGTDIPRLVLPSDGAVFAGALELLRAEHRIRVPGYRAILAQTGTVPASGAVLVNQGSVSSHITAGGTLALNLLRSCTSWPSGLWIDPPARRLPDGAPFGSMHGSHSFRYSLVPHAGDWREAGINAMAQAINQPLRAVSEPAHDGPLPPSAGFLQLQPAGVRLAALKPAGFPSARWRTLDESRTQPPRQLLARLWNGSGQPVTARLDLRLPVAQAWSTNLLEERGQALERDGETVLVPLDSFQYASVLLEVSAAPADGSTPSLDPTQGDRSPSAYWLENLSEGVTGNGVLSIVPEERELRWSAGIQTLPVHVLNHHHDHAISLRLESRGPDDLQIQLTPDEIVLEPGQSQAVRLSILPEPEARPGSSLVEISARLRLVADASDGADLDRAPALQRTVTAAVWLVSPAAGGGLARTPDIRIENAAGLVSSGTALVTTLHNTTAGPITGVASWMMPFAAWEQVPDWRQTVELPAGGALVLDTPLGDVGDTWALLKFTYGGRIAYGEPVAISSRPDRRLVSFGVDRVRLRAGEEVPVTVSVRSLQGLTRGTYVDLTAPKGVSVRPGPRRLSRQPDGSLTLEAQFLLRPTGSAVRGVLTAEAGRGALASSVRAAYTVAPQQLARPRLDRVTVDGELSEWNADEFTDVSGKLGKVRAAVRYGSGGLALAFDVTDAVFSQPRMGATIWEGDSVQFALSVAPDTSLGYDTRDLEFGAALTARGPLIWCWYGGDGGRTGALENADVAVQHVDGRLLYEMRLPRAVLPQLLLEPGSVLGFSYIANDDDGQGYQGATQWTGGMVGGKDSSLFGELLLSQG